MSSPARDLDQVRIIALLAVSGGSGRTSAAANAAWLLAGDDARVLVLDGGTEPPRAADYLAPFYAAEVDLPDELGAALAEPPLPGEPVRPLPAARFTVPGAHGHVDVLRVEHWDRRLDVLDLPAAAMLRARLRTAGYDYVLVDVPTAPSPAVLAAVAAVCDRVAVFCTARPTAITRGAEVASQVARAAHGPLAVVPVLTMTDPRFEEREHRGRSAVRTAFHHELGGDVERLAEPVEIPYQPGESYDPMLAVVADDLALDTGLGESYETFTRDVCGHAVNRQDIVTPLLRARYRASFGLGGDVPDTVTIVHAPPDRAWAEWAHDRLTAAGAHVRRTPLGVGPVRLLAEEEQRGVLVVASTALYGAPGVPELRGALDALRLGTTDVVLMQVSDDAVELPSTGGFAVTGLHEDQAKATLLGRFGLVDRTGGADPADARFPARTPAVSNVAARNGRFVGRGADLESLRDNLVSDEHTTVTLTGVRGVGKSETAREYAHRFACDYDVTWWVAAQDVDSVEASAAELRADDPPVENARWLLVLDDVAAGPPPVDALLPGPRPRWLHVLCTSTEHRGGDQVDLPPLPDADSVALLTRTVPGLLDPEARQTAAAVAHLPLALSLSAALLRTIAEDAAETRGLTRSSAAVTATARLAELRPPLDPAAVPPGRLPVAQTVEVALSWLRREARGALAVHLAELLAFLSPQGASLQLVRSNGMLARLAELGGPAAEVLRYDATEVDQVLWTGARCALFEVAWGEEPSVGLHPLVREWLLARMSEAKRADKRAHALRVLAAYAPLEVGGHEADRENRHAELQRHLGPAEALRSDDPLVRRWLVNQARYQYLEGNPRTWSAALKAGMPVLAAWRERHDQPDQLDVRFAGQLANLSRALGDFRAAYAFDRFAVDRAREHPELGTDHPVTHTAVRGLSADLRGLGRFGEALESDVTAWRGLRATLGEEHPQARKAANNLALSQLLAGFPQTALDIERGNYARRLRLLGTDHPNTWFSLCSVGFYQREMGRLDESLRSLTAARHNILRLRGPAHPDELRVRWHYALTLRHAGRVSVAHELTSQVCAEYRASLGDVHPHTLAARLSMAAVARARGADNAAAVAVEVLEQYRTKRPDHRPFIAICHLEYAMCLRAAGDHETAYGHARNAYRELGETVDGQHPWTLAAALVVAAVLADLGDVAQARRDTEVIWQQCVDFVGADHPYTRVAAENVKNAGNVRLVDVDLDIPQT
ncbi:FxSxx-COOH system tetratricopeptide repeat protein [Actinokineospora auranticolor]|uniref:Cellulose biosynthesis protein BcsQ n=1 Tax=Actinokineospora auranticolor TaxID=155976 RepID=A0A2S6GR62_9PSEU|nr:FxSxx-COOH system tetratricopeptide repeat protein [Actinokineospora auranticolor]PPK67611.1 cellulose biosynthesis protein BcsQ [Actinokineospora auranticolor]